MHSGFTHEASGVHPCPHSSVAPFDAPDTLRRIIVLRIKREGLAEISQRAGEIARFLKDNAATEKEASIDRVEPDCFVQIGQRRAMVAHVVMDTGPAVVGTCLARA